VGGALLFGAAASSALVIGSIVELAREPPERLLATILAFAAGALTAAPAFELFEVSFAEAYEHGGPWATLANVAGFLVSFLLGAA